MILQLRLSNSGFRPAMYPSSVVQTGVKSFGWENRIAHPSPIQSWKLTFPWVVSALKSGTSELILNDMMALPRLTAPCESRSGTWPTGDVPDRIRRHCAAFSAPPLCDIRTYVSMMRLWERQRYSAPCRQFTL